MSSALGSNVTDTNHERHQPMSMARWTRIAPGHYEWSVFTIKREPTTFGINRASNDRWNVYRDDLDRFQLVRIYRRATLAEAKSAVERYVWQEARR